MHVIHLSLVLLARHYSNQPVNLYLKRGCQNLNNCPVCVDFHNHMHLSQSVSVLCIKKTAYSL